MHQQRLRARQALLGLLRESQVLLVLAAIAIVVYVGNSSVLQVADQRARDMLLSRAATIAALLRPADVVELATSAETPHAAQQAIARFLRQAKQADPECRFVYVMGLRGDDVVFLADAEDTSSADYSPFGQVYDDASQGLRELLAGGPAGFVEGPVADKWGTWISALSPLRDPLTGRIIAVLGIDMDASSWAAGLAVSTGLHALPYALLIAALLLVLGRRALLVRLQYAATHDQLTGLLNRYELAARVQTWLRGQQSQGALLLVDIDNFKSVNDAYSHSEGDRTLQRVAAALKDACDETALVARQGGDEFAVVLPRASRSEAAVVAANIRAMISSGCSAGIDHAVHASIGIAPLSEMIPFEDSLALADDALRAAKTQGKNKVRHYPLDSGGFLHGRHAAVRLILQGLRENWFELWLQPVKTTSSRTVVFYEALLRLRHSGGKIILPAALLPAAHDSGLMPRIDLRAVQQALGILQSTDPSFRLSVNLSGATLADESVLAQVADSVVRAGVGEGRLVFEITESVPLADLQSTRAWVNHMHQLGCEIAIDDFGNGYCSYEYLRELAVQYVKIDGKWVRQAVADPGARALIRSVSEFARACGAKVVAEHVETDEQPQLLVTDQIELAQGYLLGPPVPAADIILPGAGSTARSRPARMIAGV